MKVMFINHAMHCGGTDKVVHSLLEILGNGNNIECELVTVRNSDEDFFKVPSSIKRYTLNFTKDDRKLTGISYFSADNIKLILKIRAIVKKSKPDFIVTNWTSTNCLTLLSTLFLNCKVISYEHIHYDSPSRIWKIARRILYPLSYKVLTLTDSDLKKYNKFCCAQKVINPISMRDNSTTKVLTDVLHRPKYILGVGRLEHQKGFDLLIEAFSKIAHKVPNWKLKIIGDGSQLNSLKKLSHALQIQDRIEFTGAVKNVSEYYLSSQIFVLSSRFEGFGLVVVEAQSYGNAVISFNCPTGPSEIIMDEINGKLIKKESILELSEYLFILINSPEKIEKFSINGQLSSQNYDVDKIKKLWLETILK